MILEIIEIKHLAHVDLAIYTVGGVKCASFVKRGTLPHVAGAYTVKPKPTIDQVVEKLESEGVSVKVWDKHWGADVRYYLNDGSADLGYINEDDLDGHGGGGLSRRKGYILGLVLAA